MQVYRLNISTIGIQSVDGKASPVVIPTGAMIGRLREETTFAICVGWRRGPGAQLRSSGARRSYEPRGPLARW
jgi:hypothetical protein